MEYKDIDGRNANCRGIAFVGDTFINCDLRGAVFCDCVIEHTGFINCDLRGTLFVGLNGLDRNVKFIKCDMSNTIFCESDFRKLEFLDCIMANADGSIGMRVYDTSVGAKFFYKIEEGCDVFSYPLYRRLTLHYFKKPVKMDGEILGYKILYNSPEGEGWGFSIAKLIIPADAQRLIYLDDKCRASKAYVEEIRDICTNEVRHNGYSTVIGYGPLLEYHAGTKVEADRFDKSSKHCSNGIHFFLSRNEAVDYFYERWC